MEVRRRLSQVSALERPWLALAHRHAFAGAVRAGAALSGVGVGLDAALAAVDGRRPDGPEEAVAAALGWADALRHLDAVADPARPPAVDDGLVRAVHWLVHRRFPDRAAGRLRPGADLRLPPPPEGADDVEAAVWTAAALRRADPCWTGNDAVAHAVEVVLLSVGGRLRPWFAGRSSVAGDPREVLEADAEGHLVAIERAEERWFAVSRALGARHLADRMAGPLWDAAAGAVLTNTTYRSAAAVVRRRPISEQQASRDLRALVDAGLLAGTGRTRDRAYRFAGALDG